MLPKMEDEGIFWNSLRQNNFDKKLDRDGIRKKNSKSIVFMTIDAKYLSKIVANWIQFSIKILINSVQFGYIKVS